MKTRSLSLILSAALVASATSGTLAGPAGAITEGLEQAAKGLDDLKALQNLDDLKVLNNLDELEGLKNLDDLKALNNLDELEALKNVDELKNLDDLKAINNLDELEALKNADDIKALNNADDAKALGAGDAAGGKKPVNYDKFLPTDEAVLDNANPHAKQFGKLPEAPNPHAKQFGKLPETPTTGPHRPLPPTPDEGAGAATKLKGAGEIKIGELPDAANGPKKSPMWVQEKLGDLVGAPQDAPGRFGPNKVSKNIGALPKTPATAPIKLTKVAKITPLAAPVALTAAEPVMGPLKAAGKSSGIMKKIGLGATISIVGLTVVTISTPYVVRAVTKKPATSGEDGGENE